MSVPWFVAMHAERLLLELRELLVRCDENLKADALMQQCVPHFLEEDHPLVERARADQRAMVRHVIEPDAYRDYYRTNEHERPFEQQYEIEPGEAHERIPRVKVLRDRLEQLALKGIDPDAGTVVTSPPTLLDLASNDGWMAQNLDGLVVYHGVDLNPDCVRRARARGRRIDGAVFLCGDAHDAARLTDQIRPTGGYDVVVAFEVVEHVPDPDRLLDAMVSVCRPGGSLFVSTPLGAVERGDLPTWWKVESKGHVRVYTPRSFHELLARHGEVEGIVLGQDQVMVAEITAPMGTGEAVARPLADGHESVGGPS